MNKKISKLICLILIISMISVLFIGCGKSNKSEETATTTNNTTDNSNKTQSNKSNKQFSYPIKGNKKLTLWGELNGNVSQLASNLSNTPFGKKLQERTGVTIEYLHPPIGQTKEQFNLLVASGDYPDMIEYMPGYNYTGGPEKAILDGFIIDLTEYMPKFAPNLMKYYKENPDIEKIAKTDTGKYYSFPFVRGDDILMVYFGPIVRKDWLDDLGLEEPETINDWYNMLKAFKEKKGASAPLSYQKWMLDSGTGSPFIGAYGVTKDFYLDDNGKVKFGPIQSGYKEFLKEFSKWYAEGLLDPDIETVDMKQVTAKMTNGDSGASLGYSASRLGVWLKAKEDNPNYDLIGTKFPSLKKGEKPCFAQKDFPVSGNEVAITTGCKDIETAMRFLDYGYSEEGHMLFNFGIEGESYDMVNGEPKYTDKMLHNPEIPPATALGQYTRSCYFGPFVQDRRYGEQYVLMLDQQKYANKNWQHSDVEKYRMPKVTPTPDEAQELAYIMNDINNYCEESYVEFLFGQKSLDDFDEYVNTIKDMGIDKAIDIYTKALERYRNR